jgi:hypothetical protein
MTYVTVLARRYASDGKLRRRMHQELYTSPAQNLDVLDKLIKVLYVTHVRMLVLGISVGTPLASLHTTAQQYPTSPRADPTLPCFVSIGRTVTPWRASWGLRATRTGS